MTSDHENSAETPHEAGSGKHAALARVLGKIQQSEQAILRQHERKTSVLLRQAIDRIATPTVSLGEILVILEDRSFGLLMLIFALPGCIPGPPALTSVLGLPLILFGWQIMRGDHKPWLPKKISDTTIQREHLATLIRNAGPYLERLEKICKPRMEVIEHGNIERALGFLIIILAATLTIPLPGTNMLPSISIAIISIGMLEKDGLLILAGSLFGIFAEIFAFAAIRIGIAVIHKILEKALS